MASMNRFEGHASTDDRHIADDCLAGRGFAPDRLSLAAFRVHIDADYARSLSALIETEIIPRMMVAHATEPVASAPLECVAVIGADEIRAFAPLVMQVEADALLGHVESILSRGVPFETVLVDLLAPTARLLGEFWEDDRCDFVDVTMGLWRLQEIVHEISGRRGTARSGADGGHRALFASMPGDQHSFGTIMIDEIFRSEGWQTDRLCEAQTTELLERIERDWFDIIGLTVSCDSHMGGVPEIIAAMRSVSKNPLVCVMVGGRIFSADPDLAMRVGADGTARDAKSAPHVASELLRERVAAPYS